MQARPTPRLTRQHPVAPLERAWWLQLAALCLLGVLGMAALLLAMRRLSGGLERPLEPTTLLIVAILVALAALAIRALWQRSVNDDATLLDEPVVRFGPTLAVVVLGLALSLPELRLETLVAFWAILLSEELWSTQLLPRSLRERTARPTTLPGATPAAEPTVEQPAAVSSSPPSAPPAEIEWAGRAELPEVEHTEQEQVLLRLTRVRNGEGQEVLHATLRIDFEAGQRTSAFHLAFCPPFAYTPEVDAFQIDGPEARLKVCQLLPYGARFDLRLNRAYGEPLAVEIEVVAVGEMLVTG